MQRPLLPGSPSPDAEGAAAPAVAAAGRLKLDQGPESPRTDWQPEGFHGRAPLPCVLACWKGGRTLKAACKGRSGGCTRRGVRREAAPPTEALDLL